MPLTIPDDVLAAAALTEGTARIEISCRLYEMGRLSFKQAAAWVGMSRSEFEAELLERGIPLYRPTLEEVQSDLEALERFRSEGS